MHKQAGRKGVNVSSCVLIIIYIRNATGNNLTRKKKLQVYESVFKTSFFPHLRFVDSDVYE